MQGETSDGPAPEELQQRLFRLQQALEASELDGALVMQRTDLIYYTGAVFQGALVVPCLGEAEIFAWRGASRLPENGPARPLAVRGGREAVERLREGSFAGWRRVGIEEDVLPVRLLERFARKVWPGAEFADVSDAIRDQRALKSPCELACVRRAGAVLVAGFEAVGGVAREGLPEYEVLSQMDVAMRRAGDQAGIRVRAFDGEAPGVVAYGPSAAVDIVFDGPLGHPGRYPATPMGPGARPLGRSLPLIVDVVAGVGGYTADMTRTFALGPLDDRFEAAHTLCVRIIEEIERKLVPGAIPEEIYLWALARADAAGLSENFMNRGPNKVRFLGHGVGLELDELPVLARRFTEPLREGMVVAVEPKVVFEDGAVGVEDTMIVRPGKAETVTVMERGLIRLDP